MSQIFLKSLTKSNCNFVPPIHESDHFDSRKDAEQLHKAMKGMGTNEKVINEILANRTLKQRREIYRAYNKLYASSWTKWLILSLC